MFHRSSPVRLALSEKPVTHVDIEQLQQSHDYGELGIEQTYFASYLECLFGLPKNELFQWPGVLGYCRYLQTCFRPLLSNEYAFLWTILGKPRPQRTIDCWPWLIAVVSTLRTLKDVNSSIDDLWTRLQSLNQAVNAKPNAQEQAACHIAVFSALCLTSMTLQPKFDWADFKGPPSLMVEQKHSEQCALKMEFVRRPITATYRQFQRAMPTTRWRHPISETKNDTSTVLHVASLDYASLNNIGKIRIAWVSNLAGHLDFDAAKRQLSIFKFPSFCALNTVTAEKAEPVPILVELLQALYGASADSASLSDNNKVQSYQEILMSYRLLFGQTSGGRRLARHALRSLREELGSQYDHLLDLLCTHPCDSGLRALPLSFWPVTCRGFEGALQEDSTYSSQDDFPLFGQRLAKLQEFSLRQQPSKLRDLWRDRRNPLQWYTFWAVLIVGGLSIAVAVLQLLVSIAQLATSVALPQPCRC